MDGIEEMIGRGKIDEVGKLAGKKRMCYSIVTNVDMHCSAVR